MSTVNTEAIKHLRATAVEPEFLVLSIHRAEDGQWQGGTLDLEIADVTFVLANGSERVRFTGNVTVNLMRSDLENIAERIDDARVSNAEHKADRQIL